MWHKPVRSLHLNRHELYHAAALFRIAVLGFCIMLPIKKRKTVDSSNWKMLSHHQQIQASVAGLMIQWFAWYKLKVSNCSLVPRCSPKVSHHLSAILEMKTTIFANCSRVIPRSAVSSMQKGSFDRSTNKCSKWNWNGIQKALCSTLKRCNHGNHGPAISEFQTIDF